VSGTGGAVAVGGVAGRAEEAGGGVVGGDCAGSKDAESARLAMTANRIGAKESIGCRTRWDRVGNPVQVGALL
jgi:hypothetical protein